MVPTLILFACGVLALLGGAAAAQERPNVLLVTIDTLRADRVGAYGDGGARTPAMDRLAREGVLVEDAVVQVPQTRPSHASILTGRQPYEHGLRDNASPPLKAGTPTLATVLRAAGYHTAAFIAAYPVSRPSGLDQGFDVYDDPFGGGAQTTSRHGAMERPAGAVVDAALGWLQRPRNRPFLAWVHLFDPHHPYEPPAPYRRARSPYDGEVSYADAQVGRLLAWLERAALRPRTLVVVTSDHGEGLGDHGEEEHLFFVYDSTLRVPLLMSWPGRLPAGARVSGQFRSVDLLPTLLDLAGVPAPATSGASRAAALRAGARLPDNESYAETLYPQLHFGYAPLRSLRAEGWKLIDAPQPELYRVAEDPGETRNLVDSRSQVAAAMRSRLATYDRPDAAGGPTAPPPDPEVTERLAALGYVGGSFFGGGQGTGDDPKDRIADYQAEKRATSAAIRLYAKADFEGAIRVLRPLAQPYRRADGAVVERRSFNVDFYLGRSLLATSRHSQAIGPLERAAALAPSAGPVHAFLAEAYRGAGRLDDALRSVERGLGMAAGNPELLAIKGRILLQKGDAAAAAPVLNQARRLDPADARVRVDLSELHRGAGRVAEALAEAREAVRLAPDSADARVALGLALGASGRETEAAASFRQALERQEEHADALFYLASVELRARRAAEAAGLLRRLLAKAPRYPRAREVLKLAEEAAGGRSGTAAAHPAGAVRLRIVEVATRSEGEDVARRAAAGEDFAALARARSTHPSARAGGDLGFVVPGDLAEPLRSAASALGPGQVSAVVETPAGYFVLRRER